LVVLDAGNEAVSALELGVGLGMVAARVDGVGLPNITPSVTGFRADMLREKITLLRIHLEMGTGIAGGADGDFQFVAAAMTEPTGQKLPLRVVFGFALHGVALLTELLQLGADRVVLTVGYFFPNPSDIRHDNLLQVPHFAA
jgi:hypothetical protein